MTPGSFPPPTPAPYPGPVPSGDNDKASFVVAIIGICFGALGAGWSFIGGACCGWAGWPLALIGLILSIVSLVLKRSGLGWGGVAVSLFAFIWVILQYTLLAGATAGGVNALSHTAVPPQQQMRHQ